MKSQRFISNYKCECYGHTICSCSRETSETNIFTENVYDVSETLAQIMVICGIHQAKAKAAIDVIIYSFTHYDEIRHRIDAVPRKRLCKEDLIHDLGRKCLMNRMEAQLTYSIIKRAFKAFYHGTSEGSIRSPQLEAQLAHSQECLWAYAAKRTAQIFASYEGMFFSAQKNYASLIKCVYKKLYDRMKARTSPLVGSECSCEACVQRKVVELPKPSRSMNSIHGPMQGDAAGGHALAIVNANEQGEACKLSPGGKAPTQTASKSSLNLPRCYKCNCPKLICDCEVDKVTGVSSADCGQATYQCQWVRMEENDEELTKPCLELPEDHECPIDCDGESVICVAECECDCESCECQPEESSDDGEAEDVEGKGEEQDKLTNVPTTSTPCNISEHNLPIEFYDDCRIPRARVVEEETGQPTRIARIVGQKMDEEEHVAESEEINRLLGSMI
ncbi:uncharacterized protein LOC118738130 [Rhagoletis pomonella]|uniref:uncharacterized protein LOC118738130 n=1 Tax=Rhagoletis pomonella TaxID=28610 RepID=UPI001783FB8E|nr:uncharacterized protein LOC118738130 [Rhagoletis pomonella]